MHTPHRFSGGSIGLKPLEVFMSLVKDTHSKTLRMVQLAFFMALIVVFQLLSCLLSIYLPVSISLVLIPIVIGGICFGKRAGAFLGAFFGVVCLIIGVTGLDGGTQMLFTINPILTSVIAILKGAAAGFFSTLIYELIYKLVKGNVYPSALIAAIVCPVVNTGIFTVAAMMFFKDTLVLWAGGKDTFWGIFAAVLLVNFVVEFFLNVVLCPIIAVILSKNKSFAAMIKRG